MCICVRVRGKSYSPQTDRTCRAEQRDRYTPLSLVDFFARRQLQRFLYKLISHHYYTRCRLGRRVKYTFVKNETVPWMFTFRDRYNNVYTLHYWLQYADLVADECDRPKWTADRNNLNGKTSIPWSLLICDFTFARCCFTAFTGV